MTKLSPWSISTSLERKWPFSRSTESLQATCPLHRLRHNFNNSAALAYIGNSTYRRRSKPGKRERTENRATRYTESFKLRSQLEHFIRTQRIGIQKYSLWNQSYFTVILHKSYLLLPSCSEAPPPTPPPVPTPTPRLTPPHLEVISVSHVSFTLVLETRIEYHRM